MEISYPKLRIIPLDEKRMIARFAPGVEIPCIPSSAAWAFAPPPSSGRISSNPPWIHAGNLDNKELVSARLSLFRTLLREPYLRWADGHAGRQR